jgi:hypothetical protein
MVQLNPKKAPAAAWAQRERQRGHLGLCQQCTLAGTEQGVREAADIDNVLLIPTLEQTKLRTNYSNVA